MRNRERQGSLRRLWTIYRVFRAWRTSKGDEGVLLPVVYRPPRGARSRELLQLAHAATMLPAPARPPLRYGMTWSAVMRLSGRSDRLPRVAPSAGRTRSTVRL